MAVHTSPALPLHCIAHRTQPGRKRREQHLKDEAVRKLATRQVIIIDPFFVRLLIDIRSLAKAFLFDASMEQGRGSRRELKFSSILTLSFLGVRDYFSESIDQSHYHLSYPLALTTPPPNHSSIKEGFLEILKPPKKISQGFSL